MATLLLVVDEPKHIVRIDPDGLVSWNGEPVSLQRVRQRMRAVAALDHAPFIVVKADTRAKCGLVREVTSAIISALPCAKWGCVLAWRTSPAFSVSGK